MIAFGLLARIARAYKPGLWLVAALCLLWAAGTWLTAPAIETEADAAKVLRLVYDRAAQPMAYVPMRTTPTR